MNWSRFRNRTWSSFKAVSWSETLRCNRISAQLERFIRGTYKGFLHIKENRAGTIPIVARYLQVNDGVAAKAYDNVVRPSLTQDGTLNQETQAKAVEHVAQTTRT